MKTGRSGKKLLMTASVYVHIRNFHLPYLRKFQELGWETHVGCAGIPADAPFIDRAIELPFEKRLSATGNFRALKILRQIIQAERYDLIITHTTLASFFTRYAIKGLKLQLRMVCVMHGYLFDDDTPFLKRNILLTAERLVARQTDLLLVMNEWDDRTARKYQLGRRVERIPGMGVDFSKLDAATVTDGKQLRESLGIQPNAFVVLCAAEFSARKSQRVLIEAMPMLPQRAVLALCGTGSTLEECRALARELGVSDRVLFPGQVNNMPTWYRMADVYVAASRSEGLPFNIIEAMHASLPVVASNVKGHSDLIKNGVNGLLYRYGNEQECSAQIERMIADPVLRKVVGQQAARDVWEYALDNVFPLVMNEYISTIE